MRIPIGHHSMTDKDIQDMFKGTFKDFIRQKAAKKAAIGLEITAEAI